MYARKQVVSLDAVFAAEGRVLPGVRRAEDLEEVR